MLLWQWGIYPTQNCFRLKTSKKWFHNWVNRVSMPIQTWFFYVIWLYSLGQSMFGLLMVVNCLVFALNLFMLTYFCLDLLMWSWYTLCLSDKAIRERDVICEISITDHIFKSVWPLGMDPFQSKSLDLLQLTLKE